MVATALHAPFPHHLINHRARLIKALVLLFVWIAQCRWPRGDSLRPGSVNARHGRNGRDRGQLVHPWRGSRTTSTQVPVSRRRTDRTNDTLECDGRPVLSWQMAAPNGRGTKKVQGVAVYFRLIGHPLAFYYELIKQRTAHFILSVFFTGKSF